MKIDGVIYTTNTNAFVQKALSAVYKRIALAKGVEVREFKVVEVKLPGIVPTQSVGQAVRISFDWLRDNYKKDGKAFCLHISRKEAKRLKLRHSNGGDLGGFYYRNEGDDTLEFFIIADSIAKFIEKFTHELGHGFSHWSGVKDRVHEFGNERLDDLYRTFDFTKWNLLYKTKNTLQGILESLKTHKKQVTNPTKLLPLVELKAADIVIEMKRLGHEVRIVQGYRSIEEQDRLYAQGRTTPGAIVTNAKGGESFHNYGVAVDFVFRKEGYNASEALWQLLGKVGKAQGFEWGGDWTGFVDRPHFELKLGYTLKDFQNGTVDYSRYNI